MIAGSSLAPASVIYRFNGTTASSLNQLFQYTAPDYITTQGYVGTASLDSCTRCTTNPFAIYFWPSVPAGPLGTFDSITFYDINGSSYVYYFAEGAFSTDGLHATSPLLPFNTGTLQVNNTATPEPPAWLFAGPAIMVVWRRYRHRIR